MRHLHAFLCGLLVAACGSGGASSAALQHGGAAGTECNQQYFNQGCLGSDQMQCSADATSSQGGKWTKLGTCPAATTYCMEQADNGKFLAVCTAMSATPTTGGDATSGSDGTTGVNVTQMKACMTSNCGKEWTACKADSGCGALANCIDACADAACIDKCPKAPDNNEFALALGMCALKNNCMPTTGPADKCGDGKCGPSETPTGCPADCKTGGPACGDGKCDPGENTGNCAKDCPATGPVCGDGKCETGETTSTCAKDCPAAGPVCGNAKCESGETKTSCPQDCGGTTTATCGDMKCDSGEASSCPLDCNSQYQATMTCGKNSCGTQWSACIADDKCKSFFNCAVMCACNQSCLKECGMGMETNQPFIAMLQCAGNAKCPDPCASSGPKCGNGTCESGETNASCPSDCPAAAKCGDGKCTPPETKTSCPQDCGGTPTGHFCDANCGGQGTGCYCDSSCKQYGDCCDATGTGKAGNACTGSTCADCNGAP